MRPLILLTNDDGVSSPGLAALAEAVQDQGELLIVAPRWQQTTMGRSFPRNETAGTIESFEVLVGGQAMVAFGVTGSPAQAVAHAVLEICHRKPDLCLSGINYGENVGLSLTCSGTLGAAFEAFSHGIPAIALSLQVPVDEQHTAVYPARDWKACQRVAAQWTARVLAEGLAPGTSVLNLNIPAEATETTPVWFTRQSGRSSSRFRRPGARPWHSGFQLDSEPDPDLAQAEPGSDIRALHVDKVISLTPLGWDLSRKEGTP
ncbi:MAG: 5'/3'-nucleotidase SurE [Spirochaetales bacterium]